MQDLRYSYSLTLKISLTQAKEIGYKESFAAWLQEPFGQIFPRNVFLSIEN